MTGPRLFTIAPGSDFARVLAKGMIARLGAGAPDLSRSVIYLPTRRAAGGFGSAFAEMLGGAALLPQFRALGDSDEDELLFDTASQDITLPPAITPVRRQLLLATLVRQWDRRQRSGALTFAQAAQLADSLGGVMDEIERQGADLARLPSLAPPELAEHWQDVTGFLDLIATLWPPLLKAEGRISRQARQTQALALLGTRLKENHAGGMVVAAGSTGSIPATAALLETIARLPHGAVVLPGLDRDLDSKSWDELDEGHPQFGLKQLLDRIGVPRDAVADWDEDNPRPARVALLRETLRPAPTTDAWRTLAAQGAPAMAAGLEGLSLIAADDPAEEALVIALALRHALEEEGRRAALVTPDRTLARRVAAELTRWGVAIDDSAGRPLAHASAGAFLCLVAEAAESAFAPVPLLALLKHPFTTLGGDAGAMRAMARLLDKHVLRGPRPDPGLAGVGRAIAAAAADPRKPGAPLAELAAWWETMAALLAPLEAIFRQDEAPLAGLLARHVAAAEMLTCAAPRACPLWRGPDGEAAARLVADLAEAAADLPPVPPHFYPSLLRSLAMKVPVRPAFIRHRAIAILGPLEARLQHFDLTILGGLNEGTWPGAAPADPWFSRPMRRAMALEQPERRIGLAAHDFAMLAAGPQVLMTRAQKVEGAPSIPARWLQRLLQLTGGLNLESQLAPPTDYLALARQLSHVAPAPPMQRPAPKPPVAARPRRLSVTEIETWLRDPYAIYARHVLKLRPLDGLDQPIGPMERGTALHKALEMFVRDFPGDLPPDAVPQLMARADRAFAALAVPRAALAVWRPRFLGAAQWFVALERARRADIARSHLEVKGRRIFAAPGGPFELHGVADRIDVLIGGDAAILDYKTGHPPTQKQIARFLTPQLLLEATILASGGFDGLAPLAARDLLYVRLSGGVDGNALQPVTDAQGLTAQAAERLAAHIAWYDQAGTPYLPRVQPYSASAVGDYDHLARVREWAAAGWSEDS